MTRTLISAIALIGAMTLSGGAMAQTMVGGASVSAEDLPKVQAACTTLAAKANAGTGTNEDENTSGEGEGSETNTTDTGATTTSIDLDLLTYEACKDAGLVQ